MTFDDWIKRVPETIKGDPLWRVEACQLSLFAAGLAWPDVTKLIQDKHTIALADQLYQAVGAVSSDVAEGYSRQSGKDQARFYEYAPGSAREGRNWYYESRNILGEKVVTRRMKLLTEIIRLLLTMIPNERGYKMQEEPVAYTMTPKDLLDNPPAI